MVLTLNLPTELEQRLLDEAQRQGLTADEYTLQLLDQSLPQADAERRAEAIALLQSWIDRGYDPDKEEESTEFLLMLDEDRLSDRKLFPPELKGITW